jgi:beta-lactam-binding protein with PASTA domain
VSGGGLVIGTQTPLESRTYPTGHWVKEDPSALFKLKGGAVVNTVVNIVAANTAAIAILFCFNTLYL